jgi:hypothetical protein
MGDSSFLGIFPDYITSSTTPCISPTSFGREPATFPTASHERLWEPDWLTNPTFLGKLDDANARFQTPADGVGPIIFDNYSMVIDRFPAGKTAQSFFDEMRQDIHSVSPHPGFSTLTEFVPRNKNQLPQLGDIIDIKIPGDNGSVMLVDNQKNYFTFNTITNLSPFDKHPESGAREFGYEQNSDGSTTLYTRGVSRPYDQVTRYGGAGPQQATWAFFMKGVNNLLAEQGGAARPDSFDAWKKFYDINSPGQRCLP